MPSTTKVTNSIFDENVAHIHYDYTTLNPKPINCTLTRVQLRQQPWTVSALTKVHILSNSNIQGTLAQV